MPKAKPLPDREWLLERLRYDPETGLFWWIKKGANPISPRLAGCKLYRRKSGEPECLQIETQGRGYKAHRLAWLTMTGDDPGNLTVDHINRNPFDNRFCNLRLANHSLQMRNRNAYGRSGIKGVSPEQGKWRAYCFVDGKRKYLGFFPTKEEAAAAAAPYFIH